MRRLCALFMVVFVTPLLAQDGPEVTLAGMKAKAPKSWKEKDLPAGSMRLMQFTVPKSEGDQEDAEIAVFQLKGSGSLEANLKRQIAKFTPAKGKDEVEEKISKIKVGPIEATLQDVKGTFLKKPFPMAEKGTPFEKYCQLYVVFETKNEDQYYIWLLGPEKTVEDNRKAFETFLKSMK